VKLTPTAVDGVMLIDPEVFADERGFFMETWHAAKFAKVGLDVAFVQDNHSSSQRGVLRGLHYQATRPQGKLIRVAVGAVFDVAVDLRRASATFGRWFGARLEARSRRMLWIPPGLAHGFLTLTDTAEVLYKCTDFHAPGDERTIAWNDGDLAIDWPLAPGETPILSVKDAGGGAFRDALLD
jgi:dTDP-4-dehydrorhamnose 3,5-epimerase